jgi:hypothetical protein
MVTRDSTGVARRRVRSDANRPRTHPKPSAPESKPGAGATEPGDCSEPPGPRDQLFKAMSIIACCRLSCASLLDVDGDPEVMTDALQAAYDLIDAAAAAIEGIGGKGGGSRQRRRLIAKQALPAQVPAVERRSPAESRASASATATVAAPTTAAAAHFHCCSDLASGARPSLHSAVTALENLRQF